jgi:hypothetical protein
MPHRNSFSHPLRLLCLAGGLWPLALLAATDIPDAATEAKGIVADIKGVYSSPPSSVASSGMPGGPVAGNGDVAIVLGGQPDEQTFYVGKADFFGVLRAGIMPVGSLVLSIPELRESSYHVEQNIGPATLTGMCANKNGSELSVKSWVAATQNLVVVELSNTGTEPLNFNSKLVDGYSTTGNEATYGSSENSTFLKVSPDSVNVELGNRFHGGNLGPFQGQIADVQIFDHAISSSDVRNLDLTVAPKPLLQWQPSDKDSLIGNATLDSAAPHGGAVTFTGDNKSEAWIGVLRIPQKQFSISAWVRLPLPQARISSFPPWAILITPAAIPTFEA